MTGPLSALNLAFVNYFNFTGRSSRAEFWWFTLFLLCASIGLLALDVRTVYPLLITQDYTALMALGFFDSFYAPFAAITAIPYLSISVRRLHDIGFSGFWWLLNVLPIVGPLILLVFYCLPSAAGTSRSGPPVARASRSTGAAQSADTHKRAMQGYAVLFDKDKRVTPEIQAARQAEVSDYYRTHVLKRSNPA